MISQLFNVQSKWGLSNFAQNYAISIGADILYDPAAASPHYMYYEANPHVVWFEDIRSYSKKYQLVD